MLKGIVLGLAALCACSKPQPAQTTPMGHPGAQNVESRADDVVRAWKATKGGNGNSLAPYLAERVTIKYVGAPDEPSRSDTLSRADAATRLAQTVEGFVVGDKRDCDEHCCHYNTSFVHGDMVAAVAAICFAQSTNNLAVDSIEASR